VDTHISMDLNTFVVIELLGFCVDDVISQDICRNYWLGLGRQYNFITRQPAPDTSAKTSEVPF